MLDLKLRPETKGILEKLETYDYACLWINGVPQVTFTKRDGMFTINRYIVKYIHEGQDWFVDGAFESDFDDEKIRN